MAEEYEIDPEFDDPIDQPAQEPQVLHPVLRCERRDATRTYALLVVPGGAELWRITESPDGIQSIKESDFKSSEETGAFLEELRRALKAAGWIEV